MTPNSDAPDDDSTDSPDDDATSPEYLILDSYLKHKIYHKSMLKLKNKVTVTDAKAATNNAYPDAINITTHSPT